MKIFFLTKLKEKKVLFDFTSFDWVLWLLLCKLWLHTSFRHWTPFGQVHFLLRLGTRLLFDKFNSCFVWTFQSLCARWVYIFRLAIQTLFCMFSKFTRQNFPPGQQAHGKEPPAASFDSGDKGLFSGFLRLFPLPSACILHLGRVNPSIQILVTPFVWGMWPTFVASFDCSLYALHAFCIWGV